MQTPDWGHLLTQGRVKAFGMPWNDAEWHAIKVLGIPVEHVRNGVLTLEQLEEVSAPTDEPTEDAEEDKPKKKKK